MRSAARRLALPAALAVALLFLFLAAESGFEPAPPGPPSEASEAAAAPPPAPAADVLLPHTGELEDEREDETAAAAEPFPATAATAGEDEELSLAGEVVDGAGRPVAGARVVLVHAAAGPLRAVRSSDASGRFAFFGLLEGGWTVTAAHAGHRAAGPLELELPAAEPLRLVLPPRRPAAVRILSPEGGPLAGARLHARVAGALPGALLLRPSRSDADGAALLDGLPGEGGAVVLLSASHPDHPTRSLRTTVDELDRGGVTIAFEAPAEISGRVIDEGGAPARALVRIAGPVSRSLETSAEGEFRFRGLPAGSYRLSASSALGGVSTALSIELEGGGRRELELALAGGPARIVGRVIGGEGEGLALVPLRLGGGGRSVETVSDAEGGFEFSGLAPGRYRIEPGGRWRGLPGIDAVAAGAEGNGAAEVVLVLEPPGSLRGRIALEGPTAGLSLELTPQGRESSGGGALHYRFSAQSPSFHLRRVPAGSYRLSLLRDGEVAAEMPVEVLPGQETGPIWIPR